MKNLIILGILFLWTFNGQAENQRPVFKKAKLKLKDQVLSVEWAQSREQLQYGLMFRQAPELKEGEGMLFEFPHSGPQVFWMKNTFIPLSIAFFNKKKKVVKIIPFMKPMASIMEEPQERYSCEEEALYALEVPAGWFQKINLKKGDPFSFVE